MKQTAEKNPVVQEADRLESALSPLLKGRKHRRRQLCLLLLVVGLVTFGLLSITGSWQGEGLGTRWTDWSYWGIARLRFALLNVKLSVQPYVPNFLGLAIMNIAACWIATLVLRRPK